MRVVACWLLLVLMTGDVFAQGQWPQFRGPTGDGQVACSGYPRTWSENQGVLWKTPIHDAAWSSPVSGGN